MIAGGSEAAVCKLGVAGFCQQEVCIWYNNTPKNASRPWDKDRDGFVMGGCWYISFRRIKFAKEVLKFMLNL